jgi:bifunctional DNA-binding transcriptional regulator/antitoxin component of YhaV-PrlF toxin-antitoxin module
MEVLIRGKVSESRRVVLPAELCKSFGIEDGADVLFSRTEHGIQITTIDQAIRRAQEMVRRFIPAGTNLAADIGNNRRQDATFA